MKTCTCLDPRPLSLSLFSPLKGVGLIQDLSKNVLMSPSYLFPMNCWCFVLVMFCNVFKLLHPISNVVYYKWQIKWLWLWLWLCMEEGIFWLIRRKFNSICTYLSIIWGLTCSIFMTHLWAPALRLRTTNPKGQHRVTFMWPALLL